MTTLSQFKMDRYLYISIVREWPIRVIEDKMAYALLGLGRLWRMEKYRRSVPSPRFVVPPLELDGLEAIALAKPNAAVTGLANARCIL